LDSAETRELASKARAELNHARPIPVYDDGAVKIFRGRHEEILRHLDLPSIDLVLTDPPYGINHRTDYSSRGGRKFPKVFGDNRPFEPAVWLMFPKVVLFGANHYANRLPPAPSWWIWDKRCGTTTNCQSDCELAWTNIGGTARVFRHVWNGFHRDSERGVKRVHPTQKPVALMRWCLERSNPTGVVLDPFMGSGSTLVAAKQLGVPAIGIETNATYCTAAAKRLRG